MSIFEYCADFIGSLLGATASATPVGQIFITYGSYLLVVLIFICLVRVLFGVFRLIKNIF